MNRNAKSHGLAYAVLVLVVVAGVAVSVCVGGCASERQKKQAEFKTRWLSIINVFEGQVASDDKQANDLVTKNDISGLLTLVNARIKNVGAVLSDILDLYPPENMKKLQAVTAFYLSSLIDQLEAQKQLDEALLAGRPTQDLSGVAEKLAEKTKAVGSELGVELQRLGIKLQAATLEKNKK